MPDALAGRRLGDYLLDEPLTSGGFGVVYRAWQVSLARTVAVKVMRPRRADHAHGMERFLSEAQIASRLDHPYAAHVYAFGIEQDGLLWIAMELVRGTSLSEFLATQGPLAPARFAPLLDKICEVVYTAHDQGLVHRDIKPSNIMVVSRAGRLLPKLLDLGIARIIEEDEDDDWDLDDLQQLHDDLDSSAGTLRSVDQLGDLEGDQFGDLEVGPADDLEAGPAEGPGDPGDGPEDEKSAAGTPLRRTSSGSPSRQGGFAGSPAYMAPEQWLRSSHSDARSDQYSLAVLTYEALTGRLPFDADTLESMADAHQHSEPPSLGPGHPGELSQVLIRAMAKNPADRFEDVLAFAHAFRSALGLDEGSQRQIHLGASVRQNVLARAPQPIADSVALMEAARDDRDAVAAVTRITEAAIRCLGVLALAAHARQHQDEEAEKPAVRVALRRLRSQPFNTRQWLELADTLTQLYAGKADAHPIPELVLLFTEPDPQPREPQAPPSKRPRIFRELALVEQQLANQDPRAALTEALPTLTSLMERLLFLSEYRMVARHNGRDVVWMGARRSARPAIAIAGQSEELEDGDVVLIGANDELLLPLSPLCRLLPPAPGVAAELFLFEGRSRQGARLTAFPVGFEWHDADFWQWYSEHLIEVDLHPSDDERDGDDGPRAPYLGLSAFSPADSHNYFGREQEVGACVNRLRVESLLAIVGPSGAGKSSFVQAGIIPALPRKWRAITVRPGRSPMDRLAARLEREGFGQLSALGSPQKKSGAWTALDHSGVVPLDQTLDIGTQLTRHSNALGRILRRCAQAAGETLVLVVDQFEELLTMGCNEEDRQRYTEALMGAARSNHDPVRVIITIRDDFLLRAQQLPALRERLSQSLQLLATPPRDELLRILIEPARRAGFSFDDPELPPEMVDAIADEPGALALLSFTASKLWEMRDHSFNKLGRRAYDKLGGVGGALAQHAEDSLARMSDDHQRVVREVFRQLVTADGTRAVLSRRELSQLLGESQADTVLEQLIAARLLVTSEGDGGEVRVEVVHEALLSSWPRLVAWQREDAESVRLRDQLRTIARQWVARDRPTGLLWRDDALLEYRVWRGRYRGTLTDDEESFAQASLAAEASGQKRKRRLLASAFGLLLIGLAVVLWLAQTANRERHEAERQRERAQSYADEKERYAQQSSDHLLDLYQEQGRLALLAGDAQRAFLYLTEARAGGRDAPAMGFMLGRARRDLDGQHLVVPAHKGAVFGLAFSPDGRLLVSGGADHELQLWDATDGSLRGSLSGHQAEVWDVAFSPTGDRLLSASWDGTVKVWSPTTLEPLWTATHDDRVNWADFTADGRLVGTASRDHSIGLWDAATGQPTQRIPYPPGVTTASFNRDGTLIGAAGMDGVARVWRTDTGAGVATAQASDKALLMVRFSPDDRYLATGDVDGTVSVTPLQGRTPTIQVNHDTRISGVAFSPDGQFLATASEDSTAKLWDVGSGRLLRSFADHTSGVTEVLFTRDGKRLLTVSRDATARMWRTDTGALSWTYLGHQDGIWTAELDPTGERLATAGINGVVRVWSTEPSSPSRSLAAADTQLWAATFAPSGTRIATARVADDPAGALVQIWDTEGTLIDSETAPFATDQTTRLHLAWHPDGDRLLLSGGPRALRNRPGAPDGAQPIGAHGAATRAAVYAADGARIFTAGDDGTAKSWDPDGGALLTTFAGHSGPVRYIDADPTGRYLATASLDGTVRLWNLASGAQEHRLTHPSQQNLNSVRFSADGQHLVTASEQKPILVWTAAGKLLASLEGHADAAPSAVFSPDGHLVASAGEDGTVKVWDIASSALIWSSRAHEGKIWSVHFSPDGNALVTARGNDAALWQTNYERNSPDQLRAFSACRIGYRLTGGRLQRFELDYRACNDR